MSDALDEVAKLWDGDAKKRSAAATAVGVTLDDDTHAKITALLAKANGNRRQFRLGPADVLRVVTDAMSAPTGLAVRHGGAEGLGRTTLALGVRDDARAGVVLGIGSCWADRPSPGRVWSELSPWMQDLTKNGDRASKWAKAKKTDRLLVATTTPKKTKAASKTTGKGLLEAILADPANDEARIVYGDWLSAQGDPRGELIAIHFAMDDLRRRNVKPKKAALTKELKALELRERKLLTKHGSLWMKEAMQVGDRCTMSRGFVSHIHATAVSFVNKGAAVFDREPVEVLELSKPNAASFIALAGAAHVARLRRIETSSPYYLQRDKDIDALKIFFQSKHVGKVRELHLEFAHDKYFSKLPTISDLYDKMSLPKLEHLEIHGFVNHESLAQAKLPALKRLVSWAKGPELAALKKAFPKAEVGPPAKQ